MTKLFLPIPLVLDLNVDGFSMILELERLSFRVRFEIVFKRDWTPPVATCPEKRRKKYDVIMMSPTVNHLYTDDVIKTVLLFSFTFKRFKNDVTK